jgi:hypothetical protein
MLTRRVLETDFASLSPHEIKALRDFYKGHINDILGMGQLLNGVWIPEKDAAIS